MAREFGWAYVVGSQASGPKGSVQLAGQSTGLDHDPTLKSKTKRKQSSTLRSRDHQYLETQKTIYTSSQDRSISQVTLLL